MALPDGGVMMLHQRGVIDTDHALAGRLRRAPTRARRSSTRPSRPSRPTAPSRTGAALAGLVLAVDAAVSADGTRVAFVSMGNASNCSSTMSRPER